VSGRAAEHRTIEEEQRMSDRLVWIDCEMTGLDLGSDLLIEVAALVTDSELNLLGEGIDIVIGADAEQLSRMPDVVREMHASSGLTDEVLASTVTLQEAEQQVLAYIQQYVPEPKKAPLCGNSIATDRGFITRDMPVLDEWLHYRMVDVSSVKELARRWYPRAYFNAPEEGRRPPGAGRHRGVRAGAQVLPRGGVRAAAGSRPPSRRRSWPRSSRRGRRRSVPAARGVRGRPRLTAGMLLAAPWWV
jgi:oligoribonuclease